MNKLAVALVFLAAPAFADNSYTLTIDTPPAKKAARGVAKIRVAPGAGYHMNKEYPTQVTVAPPAGVTVEKPKQTAKDAARLVDEGLDFDVAFVAAEDGKKTFVGELKFAVCTKSSCDPKKQAINFTVEVK
jgi:hypothetical protein